MEMKRRGRPSVSDSVDLSEEETAGERTPKRRLVQKMSVPEETRYDQMNHWPSMVEASNRQRCRVCKKLTQNLCKKCEVYLCITHSRNCFLCFSHCVNDYLIVIYFRNFEKYERIVFFFHWL